jgi:hypothetical protein
MIMKKSDTLEGTMGTGNEKDFINLMHGTYADILFILLPYMAIMMQRFWTGDTEGLLLKPEISIVAAILAGLSVSKFVLGLINGQTLQVYKERIVFFIALTIFAVLLPSIFLSLMISSSDQVPEFVSFVQPLLLIVAISLYTGSVTVSKMIAQQASENETKQKLDESRLIRLEDTPDSVSQENKETSRESY